MTRAEYEQILAAAFIDPARGEPTFIYGLLCPDTGECWYIGKSIRPLERLQNHLKEPPSNCHRSHWIQSLKRQGKKPELVFFECAQGEHPWQESERFWIDYGRRHGWPLTNNTSGGDGVSGLPAETRERMAATWLGRKHSPESLARMKVARASHPPRTQASKDRIRQKMAGRAIAWGAKLGEANRKLDPEQQATIRARVLAGEKVKDLAVEYSVHRTTISKINVGTYR